MKSQTRQIWMVAAPFAVAVLALFLLLTSVSRAADAPASRAPAPLLRPPNPASGVYSMYDTLTPADALSVTYEWVEIRRDYDYQWHMGGQASGYSDVSDPYPIGFFFPFYDHFYTRFRVSESGYIFFEKEGVDVGDGVGWPDPIPTNNLTGTDAANNFIAPFAARIYGYPGLSRVYIKNETSPRRAIIEFENMVWCCGRYNPRTFEIILYPSGDIQMQYLKMTNFAGTLDERLGRSFVVGLENLDGSAGDVYTQGVKFNSAAADYWQDEMAIRWRPNFTGAVALFIPPEDALWDDPGRSVTATAVLYLGAAESVTRSFFLTHALAVSSNVPLTTWLAGLNIPPTAGPLSGTYSTTIPIAALIPASVTHPADVATLTVTAVSTDAPPILSATYTLRYGPAHRDLQLEKRLDPALTPAAGGALRYRLTAYNAAYGESERAAVARAVVVTDLLPVGVAYEDCRRPPHYDECGGQVTTATLGDRTLVTWNLGDMAPYEDEMIWLEVRNSGNQPGALVLNSAHVTTTQSVELGYGPNNHASVTFTVAAPQTALRLYKDYWYRHDFVAAGQAIPFDVEFYNYQNTPLYGATLVDTLPPGTAFDHAELYYAGPTLSPAVEGPITPTVSADGRTLTFDIPVVDNGWWNDAHLHVWVRIPQTTSIGARLCNTATLSYPAAQAATDSTCVEVAANYVDPFVDKEPSKDERGNVITPHPGQDYTFWIRYGNRSALRTAHNVVITDTLPFSTTFVSASSAEYLREPLTSTLPDGRTQLVWTAVPGGIHAGVVDEIAVVVHVDERVPRGTLLTNTVSITYTGLFTPSTLADDTDVVTVEVTSDLAGSRKAAARDVAYPGGMVEYTIVVSNVNPTRTIPFTVADAPPAGELSYGGYVTVTTGRVTPTAGLLLWRGNVGPAGAATLTFRALVSPGLAGGRTVRNVARITAPGMALERWADVRIGHVVYLPVVLRGS